MINTLSKIVVKGIVRTVLGVTNTSIPQSHHWSLSIHPTPLKTDVVWGKKQTNAMEWVKGTPITRKLFSQDLNLLHHCVYFVYNLALPPTEG